MGTYITSERKIRSEVKNLYNTWSKVQKNRLDEYYEVLGEAEMASMVVAKMAAGKRPKIKIIKIDRATIEEIKKNQVGFLNLPEWEAEEYLDSLDEKELIQLKKEIESHLERCDYEAVKNAISEMRYFLRNSKKPKCGLYDPDYRIGAVAHSRKKANYMNL